LRQIGQTEIDAIEAKWEEFNDWSEDQDEANGGAVGHGQDIPRKLNDLAEPDPIHMDIFYNGQ
jgi:hypothetical protein